MSSSFRITLSYYRTRWSEGVVGSRDGADAFVHLYAPTGQVISALAFYGSSAYYELKEIVEAVCPNIFNAFKFKATVLRRFRDTAVSEISESDFYELAEILLPLQYERGGITVSTWME